jgi:hypothetical protein
MTCRIRGSDGAGSVLGNNEAEVVEPVHEAENSSCAISRQERNVSNHILASSPLHPLGFPADHVAPSRQGDKILWGRSTKRRDFGTFVWEDATFVWDFWILGRETRLWGQE